jgi:alpha-mannosidase
MAAEEVRPREPGAEPAAQAGRWRLVSLVPFDSQEPPPELADAKAEAIWAAVSAPWHPALLAGSAELPRCEDVAFPTPPDHDEIRIVAAGEIDRLPSGYRGQVEDSGALLIEGEMDRNGLVRRLLGCLNDAPPAGDPGDPLVLDFLALGTARWWLRDLTIAMSHADCLDIENLTREVLAGAREWARGDRAATTNRLRGAFELLTQARERFYPVDAYLADICLLDPAAPAGALADALDARAPVSFLAPARAIEAQAHRDPERLAALREAINEGWADVVGGTYGEADEPLRPLESILWQFRRGFATYRRFLDDRAVETLARRRFGLYPQLPQIARRFGFRFGLHLGLDTGRFPVLGESKRIWEAPDGSHLEALLRPPIAADRPSEGIRLPWRIGRTMRDDHVATLAIVHWPATFAGWFRDLRRVAAYSPVFMRWVTLGDYFHLTDRPFEALRPTLDDYATPYLAQAAARGEPAPISRRVVQTALRWRLDAVSNLQAIARALRGEEADQGLSAVSAWESIEDALESGRLDEARQGLGPLESQVAAVVAAIVCGAPSPQARAGYLVLNALGVARRAAVRLPDDAAADLRPEGPLIAAQFTEDGVQAVVDLPAFGFAWVPRETALDRPPAPFGAIGVEGRTLRNEAMEVEIDQATGGIRAVRGPGEPFARVGQQLVMTEDGGDSTVTRMKADRFEVDYGGPALVRAWVEGRLVDARDERVLARFRQQYLLWSRRPILEVEITLSDLDPLWETRLAQGDPWSAFVSCRWAWPDPEADLRRTSLLGPEPTTAARPETPDVLDISTRRQRTALLFGGLAHHRRHGPRMLDTLLIAGREACRRFRVGVVLDQEYPYQAALDFVCPPCAVPVASGPPAAGPSGWFLQTDQRGVAVTRVEPLARHAEGRGWGLAFHVLETTGRPSRCRLRLTRNPTWARQTDFNGDLIVDLTVDGDTVLIDLTPHELARVEVTLG